VAEGESLEDTLSAGRLADLIERHGPRVLEAVVSALRGTPDSAPATAGRAQNGGQGVEWHAVGTIKSFDHKWPGVHEHYPPMTVYEGRDQMGLVRFCIGVPQERMKVHGRERGWASVWEVVNGHGSSSSRARSRSFHRSMPACGSPCIATSAPAPTPRTASVSLLGTTRCR
jgi:hypothetical protein